jgi:hypothetical protein
MFTGLLAVAYLGAETPFETKLTDDSRKSDDHYQPFTVPYFLFPYIPIASATASWTAESCPGHFLTMGNGQSYKRSFLRVNVPSQPFGSTTTHQHSLQQQQAR